MTKEQFEKFINAMMISEHEEEDDYREDVTEQNISRIIEGNMNEESEGQ